uniref:peroxidase n=1 Tax=Oryza meridionalis TaxID=40149 RepID=A0A0E0DZN6_9ORYZ
MDTHLVVVVLALLAAAAAAAAAEAKMSADYYSKTCPRADRIIADVLAQKQISNPTTAAGVLRLFFHDCFVGGCDASVLVASTAAARSERDADVNLSLPGDAFDALARAKAALEVECPGVVSCADLLAVAARDLVTMTGGPYYPLRLGRKDGLSSSPSAPDAEIPHANLTVPRLVAVFAAKGFTVQDLVALSGAHTLGFSHCKEFAARIYKFARGGDVDPTMNPAFAKRLQDACRDYRRDPTIAAFNDVMTPGRFDNMYFVNLRRGLGLLATDQELYGDARTRPHVERYAANETAFFADFARAAQRLSHHGVKNGANGESSLLLKPFVLIPSAPRRRHHHLSLPTPPHRRLPSSSSSSSSRHASPASSSFAVTRAARELFDGSADRPPGGVGRGGARRREYRVGQGEAPPAAAAAVAVRGVAPYVVPAAAVLALSFVIWRVVQNLLPGKTKDQSSGESTPSGIMWSFAAGSNLSTSTSFNAEKESRKNLNKFYKEIRTLKNVNMAGRQFGDEGLFFLAESLAYNKSAEEVDFSGNGITAVGIEAFDGILQINTALKSLNLSGNAIGDEGAKCLSDILVENVGIQKLLLNSTNIGDEGAKAISDMLKKNKTIRTLQLSNNTIEYSGFASIAEALLENNVLRSLFVNGNYGGPLGASSLAKGILGNKTLRELHLHGNGFGNEGVRALMSALSAHKGKITVLDIGNNNITSEGSLHVAEFIKRTKSLLWLSLYMNDISDEGAEKVADALKQNKTISTVDLGGNNIHSKGVSAIAETLKDNSVVTTLELSYNPIGPEGVKALCDVLKFNGKIQTLKLGWCQIGVSGAEFVADCLKYNTTLSTLDLRANGLGDDGAICLARSFKIINESLTSLDLGFNEIRDDGAFALAQALKANEDLAVTSLNLANNFFTKFGQVALSEARDHVYEMSEKEIDIFF